MHSERTPNCIFSGVNYTSTLTLAWGSFMIRFPSVRAVIEEGKALPHTFQFLRTQFTIFWDIIYGYFSSGDSPSPFRLGSGKAWNSSEGGEENLPIRSTAGSGSLHILGPRTLPTPAEGPQHWGCAITKLSCSWPGAWTVGLLSGFSFFFFLPMRRTCWALVLLGATASSLLSGDGRRAQLPVPVPCL